MKEGIHPKYVECIVSCACGYTFKTRSTKPEIKLEVCGNCHPFFSGKQKFVDTAGRVDKFVKKYGEKFTPTKRTKKVKEKIKSEKVIKEKKLSTKLAAKKKK
ncbi:MAG: 50S ribosomal protein L31 [Endomicrobiia bacterium]